MIIDIDRLQSVYRGYDLYIKTHNMIMMALQPGVPGRVHPAEVVRAARRRDQLANLALRPVKGAEAGEPRRDGRHRLAHCADDRLPVLLLNLL